MSKQHATISFALKPYSSSAKAKRRAEGKSRDVRFALEPKAGDMTTFGEDEIPCVEIPTSIGPVRMILKYATVYGLKAPEDVTGFTLHISEGTVTHAETRADATSEAGAATAVDHTATQERLIALGDADLLGDFLASTTPGVGEKKGKVYAEKLIAKYEATHPY